MKNNERMAKSHPYGENIAQRHGSAVAGGAHGNISAIASGSAMAPRSRTRAKWKNGTAAAGHITLGRASRIHGKSIGRKTYLQQAEQIT